MLEFLLLNLVVKLIIWGLGTPKDENINNNLSNSF